MLEQQWSATRHRSILQPSANLPYTLVDVGGRSARRSPNLAISGTPVDPAASYRVTINSFLQGGGDGFPGFTVGTAITGGGIDLDAFAAYLAAHPNQAPPALTRIKTTS